MAHRSHEPARLQSRKKRLPRDRGEKYVAPDIFFDEEPAEAPPGSRGPARSGNAHDLILGLADAAPPSRKEAFSRTVRLLAGLGGLLALAGAVRLYRRR